MAALIVFLCFSAFMFAAGYQWCKLEMGRKELRSLQSPSQRETGAAAPRELLWEGMLGKI